MPIEWIKKFKPDLILQKIERTRTVSPEGGVSFSGFEHQEHMPVISSMLKFPDAATHINKSALIWSALATAKGKLDKTSFREAINNALNEQLSTSVNRYTLISSLSVQGKNIPRLFKILDATIEFMPQGVPKSFGQRDRIIKEHHLDIPETPVGYLPFRITVSDKSPFAAAQKSIDYIDLFRGLVSLHVNFAMQLSFGGNSSFNPINKVRCGGKYTIHTPDGEIAVKQIWFEPNFRPAEIYQFKDVKKLFQALRRKLYRIEKSPYRKELVKALIKYARAFDEPDSNTAFVKLWSGLESLVTPGVADYEKMVNRCSFLYTDGEYHKQVLEHLREYRNRSVHSGIEGEDARTNCFLLQQYFRTTIHFYLGNYNFFPSLSSANEFLDLSPDRDILAGKMKTLQKAIKFIGPHET